MVSNIWRGFVFVVDVVRQWIVWNHGNRLKIKVGEHPVVGGAKLFSLLFYPTMNSEKKESLSSHKFTIERLPYKIVIDG